MNNNIRFNYFLIKVLRIHQTMIIYIISQQSNTAIKVLVSPTPRVSSSEYLLSIQHLLINNTTLLNLNNTIVEAWNLEYNSPEAVAKLALMALASIISSSSSSPSTKKPAVSTALECSPPSRLPTPEKGFGGAAIVPEGTLPSERPYNIEKCESIKGVKGKLYNLRRKFI